MTYRAVKYHKRMWIFHGDSPLYTPPDFIRLQSREPMIKLADKLNSGEPYIDAIMWLECHATRSIRTA